MFDQTVILSVIVLIINGIIVEIIDLLLAWDFLEPPQGPNLRNIGLTHQTTREKHQTFPFIFCQPHVCYLTVTLKTLQ